jgi:hypothetical protein
MEKIGRGQWFLVLLWMICSMGVLFVVFADWRYDDPYITYRYAENIARGAGFIYNAGEKLLSTTTPGFALLLAGISLLGGADLHAAAVLIGCISVGVGSAASYLLAISWGRPRAAWALLVLYPTSLLLLQTLGSETPLFLALSLVALAAYARRQWIITAIACAVAVLMRGDGALLVGLLAVDILWKSRAALWTGRLRELVTSTSVAALVLFTLILTVWAVWATAYFGAPLPVTLAAKRAQGVMAISTSFFTGLNSLPRYLPDWLRWPEIALAAFGLWIALTRRRAALLPLLWTAAYVVAYSVLGVTRYFWYYAPIVPGFLICLALGLDGLFERFQGRRGARIALGALLAALLVGHAAQTAAAAARTDPRYRIYRAAGEWLHEHAAADARIGMLEVGIIGYYAERTVVDFAGLLQPDVAAQIRRESTYDDLALYAIERYQPDWLVLIVGAFPRSEAFAAGRCPEQKLFDAETYGASFSLSIRRCATQ